MITMNHYHTGPSQIRPHPPSLGPEIDKWNRIIIFFFDKRNKSLDEILPNLFHDFLQLNNKKKISNHQVLDLIQWFLPSGKNYDFHTKISQKISNTCVFHFISTIGFKNYRILNLEVKFTDPRSHITGQNHGKSFGPIETCFGKKNLYRNFLSLYNVFSHCVHTLYFCLEIFLMLFKFQNYFFSKKKKITKCAFPSL